VVDTNFSIGCIFSIWKKAPNKLIGDTLRSQVNAVISIFGPRTTAIYHNKNVDKVQELTAINEKWIVSHDNLIIKPKTKIFSPGNLRASSDNQEYR
jgi:sedoheptulose-bisphosphatase